MSQYPERRKPPLNFLTIALRYYANIWSNLVCIFCVEGDQGVRFIISVSSLTWAALLLETNGLFKTIPPLYAVMQYMGSEQGWALLFLVSGAIGLSTNLLSIRLKPVLCGDALLSALVWTISTLACFSSFWPLLRGTGFFGQLDQFSPPAALAGSVWVSVFAWWGFIRRVAEPQR